MAGRGQPPLSVRMELWRGYQAGRYSANQIRNLEMDADRSEIVDTEGRTAADPFFEDGVSTNTASYISPWVRWGARRGRGGLTEDFATMKAATNELVQVGQYYYVPAAALADPMGYGLPASVVTNYMQANPGATAAQAAAALLPEQSIATLLGRVEVDAPPGSVLQTLGGPALPTTAAPPSLPLGAMSTLSTPGGAWGVSPVLLVGLAAGAYFLLGKR